MKSLKTDLNTIELNRPNLNDIHYDQNNNIIRNKGSIYDCRVCVRPGNLTNMPKVYVENLNSKLII